MEWLHAFTQLFNAVGWALFTGIVAFLLYQVWYGIDKEYRKEVVRIDRESAERRAEIDRESEARRAEIEQEAKERTAEINERYRRIFLVWERSKSDSDLFERATKAMVEGGPHAVAALYEAGETPASEVA